MLKWLKIFFSLFCTYFHLDDKILFKDQKKWIVTNQSDKVLENSTNALKNYGALFGVSEEAFNSCMENENITDFILEQRIEGVEEYDICLLYTSPSPRDRTRSRMPSSA